MAYTKVGMGLLARLLLGVFIPVLIVFLIFGALLFFVRETGSGSLKELNISTLKESQETLTRLGEKIIQEKARDVAVQMEIYLKSHPHLIGSQGTGMQKVELLHLEKADLWLKDIAVQKVGELGSTTVYDNMGIVYFDSNPEAIGLYLHSYSPTLPDFWKIVEGSLHGPAFGYYDWKEKDGTIRKKYMYAAPVRGTDMVVAASTYMDEFLKPTQVLEEKVKGIEKGFLGKYEERFRIFALIFIAVLIILFGVIYFSSKLIVRPLLQLAEVTDKISMGDIDTPILIDAKGEVGALVKSIERMQTSIKSAIDRLQRRKEAK